MVSPHANEVEDIGLTNQPCKRSKIFLVISKGEAMTHLVLSASLVLLEFSGGFWKKPKAIKKIYPLHLKIKTLRLHHPLAERFPIIIYLHGNQFCK
jgi:hypothetical protein